MVVMVKSGSYDCAFYTSHAMIWQAMSRTEQPFPGTTITLKSVVVPRGHEFEYRERPKASGLNVWMCGGVEGFRLHRFVGRWTWGFPTYRRFLENFLDLSVCALDECKCLGCLLDMLYNSRIVQ